MGKFSTGKSGFTLIEMLMSVALIGILLGAVVPVSEVFRTRNEIDVAADIIGQSLRRAQILSQAVDGDTNWGVYVQDGSITVFQGTDYVGRDTNFDEVFETLKTVTVSGLQEVVFSKLSGLPQTTGTILLTGPSGQTRDIIINEKGKIEY